MFGGPNGEDGWIVKLDSNLCDVAGCANNTAIHEITNYKNDGSVIVFPNPCSANLFIKPEFGLNILSATIYDIAGMEIKTTSYRSRELFQINTADLSAGIYLIKLKTESGFKTIKFIKQ